MTGFPLPPKSNRQMTPEEAPEQPKAPPALPPLGIEIPHANGEKSLLSDEEVTLILKTTLRSDYYEDPRIIRFILSYMVNRNTSQAGREAGLSNPQYWREKPEIHVAIEKLTAKSVMKFGYDAAEIIERVKEIGVLDPICFENPDGSYKTHLSQIPAEARRAIKKFVVKNLYGVDPNGMKMVIGQLITVEVWDKLKSLELLGREKNIMKETKKIEHDVTANMAAVLLESKKRAEARVLEGSSTREVSEILEIEGRVEDIGV